MALAEIVPRARGRFDPDGNRLEIYALIAERDQARVNRPLDLDKSLEEIVAQASGLPARGAEAARAE